MKNLSSALLWSGASLILLPIGLVCLLGVVALSLANPIVGLIVLTILALIGRAIYEGRKRGPTETPTRPAAEITLASRRAAREARIDAAEGQGRR